MAFCSSPSDSEEPPSESPTAKAEAKMLKAPFTEEEAVAAQKQWSEVLGTPVEMTNSIGMKLALIPPGEFLMGSPDSDKNATAGEKPQHRVRITKPFHLGVYEVTQAEYRRVMNANPSWFSMGGIRKAKVAGLDTRRFPVEFVSRENAVEFCRRLGAMPEEQQAGRVYRLPTEAEWEYACRAGTITKWYCGDEASDLPDVAWFFDNSDGQTHPVGQRPPNAWGLYDMHGNVSEWCWDRYLHEYYETSPIDDPQGPGAGSFGVARDGGWDGSGESCRSASRLVISPEWQDSRLGFRVAADPPGK
jgi:formylglycine-generating enzyme required for sulfatase activity